MDDSLAAAVIAGYKLDVDCKQQVVDLLEQFRTENRVEDPTAKV